MNRFTPRGAPLSIRRAQTALAHAALLDAARAEFEANGFEGASIREIAARAGMSTGAVFNYAPSKLDLLHQVMHADLEAACERAVAAPREGSVVDQLVAVAQPLFASFAERPDLSRTLLQHSLLAQGEAGAAFRRQVEQVAAAAAERIDAARPGPGGAPTERAVLAFVSAYYFALIVSLSSPKPDPALACRQLRAALEAIRWSAP
jgi:AcrR family transcriptional regulator